MLRLLGGPELVVQQGQLLQQAPGALHLGGRKADFALVLCLHQFTKPTCNRCSQIASAINAGFGATAVDAVDGAVTAISISGLQAVNTSQVCC